VSPATVSQGGAIEVSSSGWLPDTAVTITLDGGTVLGTIQTDRFGVATGSFTVPSATAVGAHDVVARGTSVLGAAEVRSPITVVAAAVVAAPPTTVASGSLPVTGASIAGGIALGSIVTLLGVGVLALVRVARRRTPAAGVG
jgi:hypothetical protein